MLEVILTRRTVRRGFSSRVIDNADVVSIVECGLAAPSSKDEQPWRIHVVTDEMLRREIADRMVSDDRSASYVPLDVPTGEPLDGLASSVRDSAAAIATAPVALFMESIGAFGTRAGLASAPAARLREILVGYGFELIGIGAAIENMLLAIHALGLGGVFIGDVVIAEDLVRERLGLRGDLAGVVCLGHVDDAGPPTRESRPERVVYHR